MVALAVQLRARGADVRLCAPPDPELVELLAGAGVPMVRFERPWRSWVRPATPEQRTRRVAEFIAAQYDTVLAAARGCDVLLGAAMSHFVVASVAEVLGVAHRSAIFAPDVVSDPDRELWNALFGPSLDAHRRSLGLSRVEDVGRFMFTDQPWLAADPVLGPWLGAPGIEVLQTGAWMLPDLRPLPPALEAFLDAGEPPVYVGFGSMRGLAEDMARVVIEAARAHGRRVLVARGWAGLEVVDDGKDCFSVGEVNQQALFRRVAAVVHHGGAGTTTTAARAGAAQLVMPQAGGDQAYWGRRAAELGIGAETDGFAPTVESVSVALEAALGPDVQAGARAVAGWIRGDGAAVAARLLLGPGSGSGTALVSGGRGDPAGSGQETSSSGTG